MSQSVTTCLDCSFPARVETFLVSDMSVKTTPLGRQDFLIMDTVAPESNSTRRSQRLLIVPIVLVGGAMKNLEVRRIEVWATKVSFYFYSTLRYF